MTHPTYLGTYELNWGRVTLAAAPGTVLIVSTSSQDGEKHRLVHFLDTLSPAEARVRADAWHRLWGATDPASDALERAADMAETTP